MTKYLVPVLAMTLFIISACNVTAGAPAAVTIDPTSLPPVPTPVAQPLTDDNVFHDSIVGFAFEYPENWFSRGGGSPQALGYVITILSYEPVGPGGDGFPEDEHKVEIYVRNEAPTETFESIYAQLHQQEDEGSLELLSTEDIILGQGLPAVLVRGIGMLRGEFVSIYTIIKGHSIGMTVYGSEAYLWQVANSLRQE